MTGTVGARISFLQGRDLLQELAGVPVDAEQVEGTAERFGEQMAADEPGHREPGETSPLPQILSLGIDGTGIPLRAEELARVAGKQPHGSAKTREVKLGTIGSAEPFEAHGIPVRDEGSVTYPAALESPAARDTAAERSPFAQRVWREASRRRFCQAPPTAVQGNGAAGIWNLASDQFPEAVQMVDRFHAQHHWSDRGKSLYGPTDSRAAPWRGPNEDRENSMPDSSARS